MSENRIACPRCGVDWLVRVRLVALKCHAVLCRECLALWLDEENLGQDNWVEYRPYMIAHGVADPGDPREILFGEDVRRRHLRSVPKPIDK